jgi:ankyrin repeat protein
LTHSKIDVAVKDGGGNTLLHRAVFCKNLTAIDLLLANTKVDVNAVNDQGWTLLHCTTICSADKEVVDKLLSHLNIDILIQDKCGQTALDVAIDREEVEIARILFTHPDIAQDAQIKALRYARQQNQSQLAEALLNTLDEQEREALLIKLNEFIKLDS